MKRAFQTAISACEGNAEHGVHIPRWSGASGIDPITWFPATDSEDRARPLRWTCRCRDRRKVYYLMSGGGRAWIRRRWQTGPHSERLRVHDTERMRYPDAEMLWERLLLGRAR